MQIIVDNYQPSCLHSVSFCGRHLTREGASASGVGAMLTGWKWINGSCYHFDESGVMQSSKWIDGDYVDAEGKWVRGA